MTQQKSISSKSRFLSHSLFYIIILIELITPLISIIRLFVKCGAWKKSLYQIWWTHKLTQQINHALEDKRKKKDK